MINVVISLISEIFSDIYNRISQHDHMNPVALQCFEMSHNNRKY